MDPRGLRARITGARCTSCGAAVDADRTVVLADRGHVAFVELRCGSCDSRMPVVVVADGDAPRVPEAPVAGLGEADVLAMHRFLAGWHGDLRSLLEGPGGGGPVGRGPGDGA